MPVPQIPLDIVHAIAQQIDGFGPFPPFIWPLAGVCRGWRMTILPMLFKTLHIPMGQEQKCLEFLRTDTGKGISDSVKVLRIKSSLSSLLPALPHLHSHLPQIQRMVIDIRSFAAPTVEDFNECSLTPLRTLSIKSLCITIPGFLDWHRYVLWNTFMNTFLAIDELEVRFMHGDAVYDSESPAVKTMKIFREKPGSLPLIMFVDVSSLIVRDFSWCQNFPWLLQTQQTKLMIWKASSQESPLRSVTFDCASPHAFGALCDLIEVAGSDIATISLTMWNGHAPHPGNADWDKIWRSWETNKAKFSACSSLQSLAVHFNARHDEWQMEPRFTSWEKALSLMADIARPLAHLTFVATGDLQIFDQHFRESQERMPLKGVLTRFADLKSFRFVLSLDDYEDDEGDLGGLYKAADMIRDALPEAVEDGILQVVIAPLPG